MAVANLFQHRDRLSREQSKCRNGGIKPGLRVFVTIELDKKIQMTTLLELIRYRFNFPVEFVVFFVTKI